MQASRLNVGSVHIFLSPSTQKKTLVCFERKKKMFLIFLIHDKESLNGEMNKESCGSASFSILR
jgi:hypothetical protein